VGFILLAVESLHPPVISDHWGYSEAPLALSSFFR